MLRGRPTRGFTLIEILIVVIILGILAAIVMAAVGSNRRDAEAATFAASMKHYARCFTLYYEKYGEYPPDCEPSVYPAGMEEYIDETSWTNARPLGGQWDWDNGVFGYTCGVSVFMPQVTDADMQAVDRLLDDGDLNTGAFRKRSQGFVYIVRP